MLDLAGFDIIAFFESYLEVRTSELFFLQVKLTLDCFFIKKTITLPCLAKDSVCTHQREGCSSDCIMLYTWFCQNADFMCLQKQVHRFDCGITL
jgi:hypothetical protein